MMMIDRRDHKMAEVDAEHPTDVEEFNSGDGEKITMEDLNGEMIDVVKLVSNLTNVSTQFVKRRERDRNATCLVYEIDAKGASSSYKEVPLRVLLSNVLEEISCVTNPSTSVPPQIRKR
jgi:hypothetical protein